MRWLSWAALMGLAACVGGKDQAEARDVDTEPTTVWYTPLGESFYGPYYYSYYGDDDDYTYYGDDDDYTYYGDDDDYTYYGDSSGKDSSHSGDSGYYGDDDDDTHAYYYDSYGYYTRYYNYYYGDSGAYPGYGYGYHSGYGTYLQWNGAQDSGKATTYAAASPSPPPATRATELCAWAGGSTVASLCVTPAGEACQLAFAAPDPCERLFP